MLALFGIPGVNQVIAGRMLVTTAACAIVGAPSIIKLRDEAKPSFANHEELEMVFSLRDIVMILPKLRFEQEGAFESEITLFTKLFDSLIFISRFLIQFTFLSVLFLP